MNPGSNRRKTIVFSPVGTEGDIRPMACLARAARDAGHEVRLLVSPDHLDLCRSLGMEAVSVGRSSAPEMEKLGKAGNGKPLQAMKTMLALLRENCRDNFAEMPRYLEGADLLVASIIHFASHSLSEKFRVSLCVAGHVPLLVPSRHHPPPGVANFGLPRFVNALLWKLNSRMVDFAMRSTLDRERLAAGLPRLVGPLERHLACHFLLGMDPELATLPVDAPPSALQSGYWHLPSDRPLSRELESFLERGDAPVYVGFGSMADKDPATTVRIVRDAVDRTGRRALVSKGWAGIESESDGRILSIGHEPHDILFPRLAAVVHHGGAGTTWTAARAGTPQVVVPHLMDQYWWADRVAALGLGPAPIRRENLSEDRLEAALRKALDPAFAEACRRFAVPLRERNGLREGVTALEQVIAKGRIARP